MSSIVSYCRNNRAKACKKAAKRLAFIGISGTLFICAGASNAAAQDTSEMTQYVTEDQVLTTAPQEKFDATLSTNASISLTSNHDVVGAIDGFSTLFSLGIVGGLEYSVGSHRWTNTLSVSESWARTPTLDQFVKNNDQLEYESLYNYFLSSWFGPFGRFHLSTSIFDTTIITVDPKNYLVTRPDGTTEAINGVTTLSLAESLQPLTLNESLGLFAEPISTDPLSWSLRLGAGARETFATGVLAGKDDEATANVIEIVELENVYQAGLEAFTGFEGKFSGGRFTYFVGASALMPFINNDPQDRPAIELLRWGLKAGLSMSVTEWMGLNYSLDVLNDPQLLDATQIQNNLLLTFKYTLIDADDGPEPTLKQTAESYREKAKEAETKAEEYRQKAKAAEAKAKQKEIAERKALIEKAEAAKKAAQEAKKEQQAQQKKIDAVQDALNAEEE